MDLAAQLRAFRPWNEQEERDREALLRTLRGEWHCGSVFLDGPGGPGPPDGLRLGGEPRAGPGIAGLPQPL